MAEVVGGEKNLTRRAVSGCVWGFYFHRFGPVPRIYFVIYHTRRSRDTKNTGTINIIKLDPSVTKKLGVD